MRQLRRISARSVFLLFFVLYGAVGLLVGGVLALSSTLQIGPEVGATVLDRLGWWSLVAFPIGYGIAGGLAAGVAALLYNAAAMLTGGIKVELGPPMATGKEAGSGTRIPGAADLAAGKEAPPGEDVAAGEESEPDEEAEPGGEAEPGP